MRKVVLKLDLRDDRGKQKALKAVSVLQGLESISVDMEEKKLTVIGDLDPVDVVAKVRKHCSNAEIFSVGPAKEEEKKQENQNETMEELLKFYKSYGYPGVALNYHVYGAQENPSSCVVC